jgi:predicted DNA-binding transcriptional regulator AlpA
MDAPRHNIDLDSGLHGRYTDSAGKLRDFGPPDIDATHPDHPHRLLDRAAVASRLGVHPDSITRYGARGDFPEPDATFGRSPAWLPETIDNWQANRPGRTGRPRKDVIL